MIGIWIRRIKAVVVLHVHQKARQILQQGKHLPSKVEGWASRVVGKNERSTYTADTDTSGKKILFVGEPGDWVFERVTVAKSTKK